MRNSIVKTKVIADGMSARERNVKRAGDFLLATISLLLVSPLMLLIFKRDRIGRFGRPFNIYKFRSMTVDAEKNGPQLCSHKKDKRLTRIGKFLRKHHLDELPQLWNVICGDMSFIGPRPERMFYIDQIMERDPRYKNLYQIRPGVTSYATLYNGYTDTMEKMLRRLDMDLYYLEHRSWWFDARILGKTFIKIIFGRVF